HPAVAAGVAQHSDFRADPFARLRRTLTASYAVVFGTSRQADRALGRMNSIHAAVRGTVPETGADYQAQRPDLLLWVHATLVDTALRIYDRYVARLTADEAQAYYAESRLVAVRLGVPDGDVPATLDQLRDWMAEMTASGAVSVTPTARSLAPSVLYPSRALPRFAWDAAHLISYSVLPPSIRRGYRIGWSPARERAMDRVASVSRRLLPLLPATLREMPHARSAERRLGLQRGR
ncbi:MAG TPA: oxygenase MpaB family protein, partial [Candidatus Limnocylindrales bacterium]|nr:oxygenase MpaB family protein [Candidatus Limnocylindrales bacterium]